MSQTSRWFQFSLGSLLLLIALVAVSIFAAREYSERTSLDARLRQTEIELENTRGSLHSLQKDLRPPPILPPGS